MVLRSVHPISRLAGGCLLLGLLTMIGGCNRTPHAVEHANVSGKVLLEGKPVPGGRVTFVAVNGGFVGSGNIDENGNYDVKAPVGETIITVDNSTLQPRSGRGPSRTPHPKKSGAEEEQTQRGRWVNIPSRYADTKASGLNYTVKPGPQTHDIELSEKIPPPPGSGQ